jgi:hypothetical protein
MSNRSKHLELLKIPYKERDQTWHVEVEKQFKSVEVNCQNCNAKHTIKIFKDEANPLHSLCPMCQ